MSTDAQLTANRANAQSSTGPATPEGKTRSSQNAVRHGLSSRNILLKGESLEDWTALREQLRQSFQVEGDSEASFLDDATHATWKLQRIEEWQTMIVDSAFEDTPVPPPLALLFGPDHETILKRLERYERSCRTALKSATAHLRTVQKARASAASEPLPAQDQTNPIPASAPLPPAPVNGSAAALQPALADSNRRPSES